MYKHTQPGWTIWFFMLFAVMLTGVLSFLFDVLWLFAIVFLVLAILTVYFASLTVTVDEKYLAWYFGPGFWKKRIELANIESFRPVRNRWYYGWGIRKIPGGWLYNVSGLSAVEITQKDGKIVRIGTDESNALVVAISDQVDRNITG